MRSLIPKDCAVDALLSAVVDELAPDEKGIGVLGTQDNLLAGADELGSLSAVSILASGVMSFVEFKAVQVSIFCEPPERIHATGASELTTMRTKASCQRPKEQHEPRALDVEPAHEEDRSHARLKGLCAVIALGGIDRSRDAMLAALASGGEQA